MNKKLITIVIGTRPEAIKLMPVFLKFNSSNRFKTRLILTGQHKEMVEQVLQIFGVVADIDFSLMKKSQTLNYITSEILNALKQDFNSHRPTLVIVQGDTTTAFSSALAAFYEKIPIAHVEAGLRTNDIYDPFPEEANRRLISQLASIHFAPTVISSENLKSSSVTGNIYITGNTVVDSVKIISKNLPAISVGNLNLEGRKLVLTTIHRRENWGDNLLNIIRGIELSIEKNTDIIFLLPMHPNRIVRDPLKKAFLNNPNVILIEPLNYSEMISAMKSSYIILTDSGGIQEEAPGLGKPLLILRKTTERPEVVDSGNAVLVGSESNNIEKQITLLANDKIYYENMSKSQNPFGDGNASERIFNITCNYLNKISNNI